jgi:hypothetical protein
MAAPLSWVLEQFVPVAGERNNVLNEKENINPAYNYS